jgi:Uma2 family endonuclease
MKTEVEPMPLRNGKLWPLSVAAYHVLGEEGLIPKNAELLYGFVYTKMSKSPLHTGLVLRLIRLLRAVIGQNRIVRSEQPITCVDSEPEPDISVVNGREEDFWTEHPRTAELVIEVCISSHDYDRSKLRAYASAGVRECWFVLAPEKQIEVYREPNGDDFAVREVFGPGGELKSVAVPEFKVDLKALFAK